MKQKLVGPLSLLILLAAVAAQAAVKLPAIIGDSMVLQRDKPLPIWGWDDPGQEVKVSLGETSATAKADEEGRWSVTLPAMKAGGPYVIKVEGSSSIEVKDVLVGEVWLCSGQSNMEWTVSKSSRAKEEIKAANYPNIRHIKVQTRASAQPEQDVVAGGWQVCNPKTVRDFSAVGYYFARELQKELDGVPIGLIGSNWGGTRIEPWTPPEGFKQVEALKNIADNLDNYPEKKEGKVDRQSTLAIYNGMIHGLVPYAFRGVIWYQGESNNGEGMLYHEKMKALIAGWRNLWKNPDMPFYFVQLAPHSYGKGHLPGIWEAQTKTLSVPHTGMAVTVDISNIENIHPRNKHDVGKRLALWALAKDYGKSDLVYSGPMFKEMKIEGNQARLEFDHVGGGLISRDSNPLTHFQIAGEDRKFVDAKAEIDGDAVVVKADGIDKPVAVRFGWIETAEPNLSNKEGLPASPFRTDNWR